MDIFEREALGIRGRFGVDVWEKWLSFQHSQEDFLRNYGVRDDRIDGTVLALKRLLRDEGIVADKDYRRANRKVASNPLFIRLLASRGVYGVGISGDIMAYVDLPIDENGTNFYWVVIDSNGDEIVGGPSSSFEEATSLAETNLFRLSGEPYPYTSHRANHKVATRVDDVIDYLNEVHDGRIDDYGPSESDAKEVIQDAFYNELGEPGTASEIQSVYDHFKASRRANRKRASNPSPNSDFVYTSPGDVFEIVYGDDDQATGYPLLIDGEPASIEDFQDLGLSLTDTRVTRDTENIYDDGDVSAMYENDNPQNAETIVKVSTRRANRKRAYDETDLLLDFLNGDMSSDSYFNTVSPGPSVDEAVKAIFNEFDPHDVDAIYDWYYGKHSPLFQDALNDYAYNGGVELGLLESRMREMIEHNLPV